jgi:hypothetical protein
MDSAKSVCCVACHLHLFDSNDPRETEKLHLAVVWWVAGSASDWVSTITVQIVSGALSTKHTVLLDSWEVIDAANHIETIALSSWMELGYGPSAPEGLIREQRFRFQQIPQWMHPNTWQSSLIARLSLTDISDPRAHWSSMISLWLLFLSIRHRSTCWIRPERAFSESLIPTRIGTRITCGCQAAFRLRLECEESSDSPFLCDWIIGRWLGSCSPMQVRIPRRKLTYDNNCRNVRVNATFQGSWAQSNGQAHEERAAVRDLE